MSRLSASYLIENLEKDGMWRTQASDWKIDYSCLKCGRAVEATLEVIAPYTPENHGSLGQRYLSERKSLCRELAVQSTGRCLGTVPVRMRGGSLPGFQSKLENAQGQVIETVLFYSDQAFGPQLIKATISIEKGARVPPDLVGIFREHMTRLTDLW